MVSGLPNALTIGRIAVIPVIVALLFLDRDWARWSACALFTIAGLTDFLDGYLARALARESRIGRFLDPIADKLLVGIVLLMLVGTDSITTAALVPAAIILGREILVSGLREHLAELNVSMPVSRLAKWKTMMQMVAIGVLIVGDAGPAAIPVQLIGEIGLWAAAVLTLVTGWDYLSAGVRHIRDEEAVGNARRAPPAAEARPVPTSRRGHEAPRAAPTRQARSAGG
jgi:cardiolipin synthase